MCAKWRFFEMQSQITSFENLLDAAVIVVVDDVLLLFLCFCFVVVVVVFVVVIVVVVVVVFIIIIVVVTIIISEVPLPSRKSNRSSYISFRKYSSGDYLLYNTLSTYNFSALRPLLTDF